MLTIFIPLIAILALGAWGMAVFSAISLVSLAPKGEKLSTYFALGWWRFQTIRTRIGPAADPHLQRYRLAFLGFFSLIVGVIVATAIAIMVTAPETDVGLLP